MSVVIAIQLGYDNDWLRKNSFNALLDGIACIPWTLH